MALLTTEPWCSLLSYWPTEPHISHWPWWYSLFSQNWGLHKYDSCVSQNFISFGDPRWLVSAQTLIYVALARKCNEQKSQFYCQAYILHKHFNCIDSHGFKYFFKNFVYCHLLLFYRRPIYSLQSVGRFSMKEHLNLNSWKLVFIWNIYLMGLWKLRLFAYNCNRCFWSWNQVNISIMANYFFRYGTTTQETYFGLEPSWHLWLENELIWLMAVTEVI